MYIKSSVQDSEEEAEDEHDEEEAEEEEDETNDEEAPVTNDEVLEPPPPPPPVTAGHNAAATAAEGGEDTNSMSNVPPGIDPSFLAALPADMRQEVIEEHLRVQRNREEAQRNANQHENHAISEINSEFLAALPPNIQEEVLAQQRIDLRQQAAATASPNDPVDAAAFFQNLSPSLRQSILTDMEESQISVLPPDLAAEAQNLRRDYELMQQHVMNVLGGATGGSSSTVLRYRRRNQASRADAHIRGIWGPSTSHSHDLRNDDGVVTLLGQHSSTMDLQGSALLDQEGLTSILVMLFIDAPKFNALRFHRVVRNLCFHVPTRQWIIRSLLAIMERTSEKVALESKTNEVHMTTGQLEKPTWLNIRLDPSLGSRANVFIYNKALTEKTRKLLLHPQAANFACCHALELLTLLAKTFAANFMPTSGTTDDAKRTEEAGSSSTIVLNDFWEILLRLDGPTGRNAPVEPQSSRAKNVILNPAELDCHSLEESPFGRLILMLKSMNIQKSRPLTDKLLRLLALVSIALPKGQSKSSLAPETTTTTASEDPPSTGADPPETASGAAKPTQGVPLFIRRCNTELLSTIVNVLCDRSCSEDGLNDITTLIVNLSQTSSAIRDNIVRLLVNSASELGQRLEKQIQKMMEELRDTISPTVDSGESGGGGGSFDPSSDEPSRRGTLHDRFTREVVVISPEGRPLAASDLQLPAMAPLVVKTSNQVFFLRTLKILIQIRMSERDNPNHTPLNHILNLDSLWAALSDCLELLKQTHDPYAFLVLQSAVEAFFLMHAPPRHQEGSTSENKVDLSLSPMSPIANDLDLPPRSSRERTTTTDGGSSTSQVYQQPTSSSGQHGKFLKFAEKHRIVLNQILRQYATHLADGPFAVLVDHTRILDFDVKRRYFRTELERLDEGIRREELAIHVNRMNVFEDSFRELYRRNPEEWKNRFYISFEDEEGQDAGGLLREWYVIISREIFNPNYALFTVSPGDRVTYMINPSSHANSNHLCYYKFVGRVIAKAIYDNKLLECYFTRSLYKHILGIRVKYTDMESEDYDFYKGLVFLKENDITALGYELTFSLELQEFGVTEVHDLIPNGRNIAVTEENKLEYIRLVCQLKMSGSIKQQLNAFLEGFYDIIPKRLIAIFNEQELELLISGLPNIDIEDLRANTEYHKYSPSSIQIQWFWRALRSFDQADRAKFLQFVTGTSKVPLQGFAALEGMNGIQKFQIHRDDRSTDRLPSAHTCFNQLDLPVYKTYDKLRECLYKAIHECSEGFGFA
ncbi:hypothetical protein DMENIID0001_004360 [Sergentomyia squamirostris]